VSPRIKALGLALPLVALLMFFATHILSNPEPTYHSQPLSYWIEQYRVQSMLTPGGFRDSGYREQPRQLVEARSAICAIGTNGLPHLVAWMRYQPPLLGTRFMPWAPLRVRHKVDRTLFSQERANRAEAAMQALEVLGTNTAPAIPALTALATKTKASNTYKARRAAITMSRLGPEALPAILNLWSNCVPGDKQFLSTIILPQLFPDIRSWPYLNIFPDTHSKDQVPVLLYIMQVHGEPFRSAASNAVWCTAPDLLTNSLAQ
jgi:hypothetical protein